MIKRTAFLLCAFWAAAVAQADENWLSVELPTIKVAEYHRPYVAVWLRNEDSGEIHNVAVWYQIDKDDDKGEQWLKDMRQWWRRSGRSLEMPVDGVSGATRAPGVHKLELSDALSKLEAGNYQLYVEAAREVGGRELLKLPFSLPLEKTQTLTAQGQHELGKLELHLAR